MLYISVDIEADGPCPGLYSMISLGAVPVRTEIFKNNFNNMIYHKSDCFKAYFRPLSNASHSSDALRVSGFIHEETLQFPPYEEGINAFHSWLKDLKRQNLGPLHFVSDNNGFDWQFVNYYLWLVTDDNPFGHSSINLSSLYKGFVKNTSLNMHHLRHTPHTHDPLDDAYGNAEVLRSLILMGLKT